MMIESIHKIYQGVDGIFVYAKLLLCCKELVRRRR